MWKIFRHNLRHLFIAIDQLLNVLICMLILPREKSYCDETFSSRIYRWDRDGKAKWPRVLVDHLAWALGDKDHCRQSYLSELERRQLPKEFH